LRSTNPPHNHTGAGSLFGLAIATGGKGYVDDALNTLRLLH
jgi:hypothetical protein